MELSTITLDQARSILDAWVRQSRWLHRDVAKRMEVTSFRHVGAHHIRFEQFYERREVNAATRPHAGGPVDGPESGAPPDPWAVPFPETPDFEAVTLAAPLPHTISVHRCDRCGGEGRHTCEHCNGERRVTCPSCGGRGRVSCGCMNGRNTCPSCGGSGNHSETRTITTTEPDGSTSVRTETATSSCGSCGASGQIICGRCGGASDLPCSVCGACGQVTCSGCGGDGRVVCAPCGGHGRVERFQNLTVTRHYDSNVVTLDAAALPEALVLDACGVKVLEECDVTVSPDNGAARGESGYRDRPVRVSGDVDAASRALIEDHAIPYGARSIRERLRVTAVPIHEGAYRWGGRALRFYLYGLDARVYAPDFPRSSLRIGVAVATVAATLLGISAAIYVALSS